MPPLCSLFREANEPMCPGLPGDPPGPETLAFLTLCWFVLWLAVVLGCVLHARRQGTAVRGVGRTMLRTALIGAGLSLAVFVCAGLNIVARNYGRWADLKHALTVFSEDARVYEGEHGPLDSEQAVGAFYEVERRKGRVLTFQFSPHGPEVDIVYRWWAVPPRPMIIWARGRSAGFDLDTMICDAFD